MTREKEIIAAATENEKHNYFGEIVKKARNVRSAYGIGFLEGAVWADNTMIEKACEWLFQTMVENNWISGYTDIPMSSEDVEQFRKAMEGGDE